jgi:hypothetical protein
MKEQRFSKQKHHHQKLRGHSEKKPIKPVIWKQQPNFEAGCINTRLSSA